MGGGAVTPSDLMDRIEWCHLPHRAPGHGFGGRKITEAARVVSVRMPTPYYSPLEP